MKTQPFKRYVVLNRSGKMVGPTGDNPDEVWFVMIMAYRRTEPNPNVLYWTDEMIKDLLKANGYHVKRATVILED